MKLYFNFFHYFLFPTFILIIIIIGCTPGRIVVQASDKSPEKVFTLDENLKFLAFDERKIDPKFISNYGDKNSKTILFSDSVNTYVENYFNKSFIKYNVNDSVKTVLVFIDQFKIEESATQDYGEQFKYSFRFSIPITKDTSVMFRVASKYSNNGNSLIPYDQMINIGLTECLDSFLSKRNSLSGIVLVQENQISKIESMNSNSINKKIIEQNLSDTKEQKIETNYIRNEKHNAIGFTYLTGNKIVGGGQGAYFIAFGQPEGNTLYGYGVGLLFYSVENTEDNIKGYFLGGYVPFSLQYYFVDYEHGPFIGSFVHLMIGQEKIDYGYEDKTNIYIGPNFDLFFGMKFLDSISVDAGFYLVVLAGSDILPNDNGFRINLRIWQ